MYLLRLALQSLKNRRVTALLTVLVIALSVTLLLTVERVRSEARASFASTISGTDLIVGARSGSVQLLLYSVFRIGNATNNIRWESYNNISTLPQVKWAATSLWFSARAKPSMTCTTQLLVQISPANWATNWVPRWCWRMALARSVL